VEVEVLVEGGGFVVDGVDQHGSGAELSAASYAAAEGVDEKVAAEGAALFGPGDGQSGEEDDRYGVGHASTETGWSLLVGERAHGQGVVAGHARTPAQHVSRGGSARCRHTGRSSEPGIELVHPAFEVVERIVLGQQTNRPQGLEGHWVGIGLRFLA
jgi:hypothetical protein